MKNKIKFLVLIIIVLIITGCEKEDPKELKKINVFDYVQIEENGYDSYGHINAYVQYELLFSDIALYANDTVKKSNIDIIKYSIDFSNKNNMITIVHDNVKTLKNGDIVSAHFRVNNIEEIEKLYDVEFIMNSFEYKITKLTPLIEYNPFDDLVVDTKNTISGKGSAYFTIQHLKNDFSWEWQVSHNGTNGTIANGDILSLTIRNMPNVEEFAQSHGVKITTDTYKYTVNNLKEFPKTEADFKYIGDDIITATNNIVQDWVIDGLNDENQGGLTRKYELVNKIFLLNDSDFNNIKNKLFLIYKITDTNIPEGYYIYISPQTEWLIDMEAQKIVPSNNQKLSNSFVYYDKETIRWSKLLGWGQGYEGQGFLRNNIPYAGHETLFDEIEYIKSVYDYGRTYNKIIIETPF